MASFNFGNSGLTTSTPAKPAGFGNFSFGANTATPAFGANTTTPAFGASQATPAFGASQATPAFGASQATPAFGASQATPAFGANQATPVFGASQTTPAFGSTTGAFGQASSAPAFGATGFGTNTASTSTPSFGFGTQTTASTPFGGGAFGTTQNPTSAFGGGFSGFGATPASTAAPTFNAFGTSGFGATPSGSLFGGFGNTTATGLAGGFGSTFGKPAAAPTFGATFGQPQQLQQQQQQPLTPDECFAQSLFNVSIFGDERDTIIAKWNYLQAIWGTGKAYYNQNAPPIDIVPQNFLCRFKAMGYSKMPGKDNKMGLVSLVFNKTVAVVKEQQPQIVNQLNQVFGNKPNIIVNVDNIVPLSDSKCQLVIFLEEKFQSSETKRILATELCNYLNQPMTKTQVTNMGVEQVIAMVLPDEDLLKEYLENSPKGVDPRMWKQAKTDNPDPTKFIPVPIIGFSELNWRTKCQETETATHRQYMLKMEKEIEELKQRHASTTAKMMEYRRKLADISHRLLKIIVKQEITRKVGYGIGMSPEEEILRSKLENMQVLVSAPTQFKGRLSELLSQMRMQRNQWHHSPTNGYTLDKESSEEMKTFLTMQQKAMAHLIETVNNDMKSLKIITDGMNQMLV